MDIRVDKLGVDVELMSVPWYAQIPKDIAAMYACCSYGKQYEELLKNAKHLGQRWYAMVKLCETRFAQSELMVYKNFEKNYKTYRTTWSGDAGVFAKEKAAAARATKTEAAREAATAAVASASASATTTTTDATTAAEQLQHWRLQQQRQQQRGFTSNKVRCYLGAKPWLN